MSVHVVVGFGFGNSFITESVIDSYMWGNVKKISPVITFNSRSCVVLEAEDIYTAESQRDRLSSGMIGARVIQTADDMAQFFYDLS